MGRSEELARAACSSEATPEAVWSCLVEPDGWSAWSSQGSASHLSGPLRCGTRGIRVDRTGARRGFVVTVFVPGRTLADRSRLIGARLERRNDVRALHGGSEVVGVVTIEGPLRGLYRRALRSRLATDLPAELGRLTRLALQHGPAAA